MFVVFLFTRLVDEHNLQGIVSYYHITDYHRQMIWVSLLAFSGYSEK